MPSNSSSSIDIFGLLSEESSSHDEAAEKKKRRQELLGPTGVKELYKEGNISINKFTCVGGQCKNCIKKCPTNALYWSTGGVEIIEDLCVYCGACVVNCMVDNCIKVERTREDGVTERVSKPSDAIKIFERNNAKKRVERVKTNAVTSRRLYKEKDKEYQNPQQLYVEQEYKA